MQSPDEGTIAWQRRRGVYTLADIFINSQQRSVTEDPHGMGWHPHGAGGPQLPVMWFNVVNVLLENTIACIEYATLPRLPDDNAQGWCVPIP